MTLNVQIYVTTLFTTVESVFLSGVTVVLPAVALANNAETAVTKTADTSVKFSSHRIVKYLSVCKQ